MLSGIRAAITKRIFFLILPVGMPFKFIDFYFQIVSVGREKHNRSPLLD
jgi:hypothetical protein